jgi:hypothetical protein
MKEWRRAGHEFYYIKPDVKCPVPESAIAG